MDGQCFTNKKLTSKNLTSKRGRGIRVRLAALIFVIAPPMMAVTPAASAAPWQQLRPVGQGEMNWLWFKLYDATLYSKSGRYVA
ncbi:MAG: hypothetical protein ACRC9N_10855, partial [Aeromonas sp.]